MSLYFWGRGRGGRGRGRGGRGRGEGEGGKPIVSVGRRVENPCLL
jgi:hypothetical protein